MHLLDLTTTYSSIQNSDLSLRISEVLHPDCKQFSLSSLYRPGSSLSLPHNQEPLIQKLQEVASGAGLSAITPSTQALVDYLIVQLDDVHDPATLYHPTSAIHWPSDGLAEVKLLPMKTPGFFSKYKTYLLVGLSGKIGHSLTECMVSECMVSNGAGCVCLTSRNPAVDEKCLELIL